MAAQELEFTIPDRQLYPEGRHVVQIVDFEQAVGKFGIQLKWKLELIEVEREDDKPAWISYFTSFDITVKTKLGKMLMACGIPLPTKESLAETPMRPSRMLGERFFVTLVHAMGSDSTIYANVAENSVLPLSPADRKRIDAKFGKKPGSAAEPAPAAAPAPAPASAPVADVQAAVTAGEDAKSAAVGSLLGVLAVLEGDMEERGYTLNKDNTGLGLKKLAVAKKAQGASSFTKLDFSLISLEMIAAAQAEALTLIGDGAKAEEADPFVVTGDVEE